MYLRIIKNVNLFNSFCIRIHSIHEPSNTNFNFITLITNFHPPELNSNDFHLSLNILCR